MKEQLQNQPFSRKDLVKPAAALAGYTVIMAGAFAALEKLGITQRVGQEKLTSVVELSVVRKR